MGAGTWVLDLLLLPERSKKRYRPFPCLICAGLKVPEISTAATLIFALDFRGGTQRMPRLRKFVEPLLFEKSHDIADFGPDFVGLPRKNPRESLIALVDQSLMQAHA